MKQTIRLTVEKFAEIYTNEEFRNQVAYAHQSCDRNGNFIEFITCSYPITYAVTQSQIDEAAKELERARIQTIKDNEGKLMFTGMGMTYPERYPDDVCNHRIRVEFTNRSSNRYFIELGTMGPDEMRCDFSIDRSLQERLNDDFKKQGQFYNCFGLERNQYLGAYTKSNVLNLVNKYFDCKFTGIVIDNYNVNCDDYNSISPK